MVLGRRRPGRVGRRRISHFGRGLRASSEVRFGPASIEAPRASGHRGNPVERGLASRHGSAFRCSIPALRRAKRWFEGRWSPAGPAGQRGPAGQSDSLERAVVPMVGVVRVGASRAVVPMVGVVRVGASRAVVPMVGVVRVGASRAVVPMVGVVVTVRAGPAGRSFRWSGWSRSKGPGCRPEGVGRRGSSWCGQVRSRGVRGPCGPRCTEGRTVDACPAHGGR